MTAHDRDGRRDPAQQAAHEALATLAHVQADPAFHARLRSEFAHGALGGAVVAQRRPRWAAAGAPGMLGVRWGLGVAAALAAVLLLNVLNRGPSWQVVGLTGPAALRVDGRPLSIGADSQSPTFLAPGARVQVPAGAELTLMSRGTLLLQAAGGSDLVLPGAPGRWWGRRSVGRLQAGEVRFTTGAAFAGASLQMTTPEATVEVVGTTFAVIAMPCVTCVCVYEGDIRLRPLGGSFESVAAPRRKMVFSDGRPAVVGELEPAEREKLGMIRDAGARMLGAAPDDAGAGHTGTVDAAAAGTPARGQAPNFQLPRHGGGRISLGELRAKGPVVVDFWATWCAPCKRALPRYQMLQDRYAAHGVTIVAVSEDDPRSQAKIEPYLQAQGLTLAVALDPDGRVAKEFGVSDLPTTFLVGTAGQIVAKHVGYVDGAEQTLEAALRAQLGLPAAEAPSSAPAGG